MRVFSIEGVADQFETTGTGAGHLLVAGMFYELTGENNVSNFRCINAVASSGAKLKCTYLF